MNLWSECRPEDRVEVVIGPGRPTNSVWSARFTERGWEEKLGEGDWSPISDRLWLRWFEDEMGRS